MKHQIDILEESIPDKYDDGIVITENDNISEFEINDNMAVNNRTLGKCRFKLMTAYYQYKRKKARWISTAERTCSNMLSMEDCNEIYIQRNKSSILDYVKEIEGKLRKALNQGMTYITKAKKKIKNLFQKYSLNLKVLSDDGLSEH
eukprot:CAMPEP_0197017050 /NCGR_PEP_ID=MMETSP1380-20130617/79321_1 /TAXON_ID=5936 /ORGANISM="Euplotes crassus, Strain CT5" /LENGTH=145 /DNA_ID=CAMNT_0042444097 /DNA_START=808 /DNA_END=1246 /DNA_ORIENTATION=-